MDNLNKTENKIKNIDIFDKSITNSSLKAPHLVSN